jgi:hypothetical protein
VAFAPAEVLASDQEVLDVVLRDLLSIDSGETPLSVRGMPPEKLLVRSRTAMSRVDEDNVLYRYQADAWHRLSAAEEPRLRAAARNLVERARAGGVAIWSADERVVLVEPDTGKPKGLVDRPLVVLSPGFSPEGSLAVVRMTIPWSIHHATATYVLRCGATGWAVVVRQFIYHP